MLLCKYADGMSHACVCIAMCMHCMALTLNCLAWQWQNVPDAYPLDVVLSRDSRSDRAGKSMLRCCDRRNTGCPAGKSRCEQPQEVCQGFASELRLYPDWLVQTKSRLLRNQEMPGLLRKSCAGPISAEGIPTACRYPGKKTSFLSVFFKTFKNDLFAKTGSGQT